MTWNFRVIRKTRRYKNRILHSYDMHEVYYNAKGQPTSWTEKPIDANGYESLKEMQQTLCRMLADSLERPVLEIRNNKLVERKQKI